MAHNPLPILALCSILVMMTHAASPSSNSFGTKFAELSDQFVKESLALSPTNASAAGYHKHVDSKTGKTVELDALRSVGVTPGPTYILPYCDHKNMKSPEVVEKFKRGPVGLLTIRPSGPPAMGKSLVQWFLYCIIVGIFTACVVASTQMPGTEYRRIFHLAGIVAFAGYSLALIQNAIWKGETWGVTFKHVLDGLIYGLLTAGTFGWLWPKG